MKKMLLISMAAALACTMSFAADGAKIYKKCKVCHGKNAEKVYLKKVPALNTLTPEERLADMKAYKAGTVGENGKGKYKMGGVMKTQMKTLSEDDMKAVNEYISTLKK